MYDGSGATGVVADAVEVELVFRAGASAESALEVDDLGVLLTPSGFPVADNGDTARSTCTTGSFFPQKEKLGNLLGGVGLLSLTCPRSLVVMTAPSAVAGRCISGRSTKRCDDRLGSLSGVEEGDAVGSVGRARIAAPVERRLSLSS